LPGAVVTSFLWLVLSFGFRLYIGISGTVNQILGVLGGALILMLWAYLLSLSFLVGAEVNDVLIRRRGDRWRPRQR
jgi:membrane protein